MITNSVFNMRSRGIFATMEPFLKYLKNYITLTEQEQSIVSSKLTNRSYLKGQYILQSGDVCRHQTYIVKGSVRTFCQDDDGSEHVISFGIEKWWVGDLESFASQTPADFNIQCLDKTDVIQINRMDLDELYRQVPKMERFFRLIIQKAYSNLQRRILRNYSLSAKDRYLLFCEEYPEMIQRVPQYMIASYLGITKEFLSTIRKQISL